MRVWQHEVLGDVKRLHVVLELFGSLVAHQARGEAGLVVNQEDRRIVFGKAVVTVRHVSLLSIAALQPAAQQKDGC
jgi:hypothetical protein